MLFSWFKSGKISTSTDCFVCIQRTSKYCPQVVPRLEKPKGGRRQVMMAGPGGGKGRE